MPRTTVGFETPFPDFSDCNFAAREADADWIAVVHRGGPARAFSEIMPAFGEALSPDQIEKVVGYLRGFCAERAWPRELNLPRAMVTEKAFPEDETVLTVTAAAEGAAAVIHKITYERRFGAKNQIELVVPFGFRRMQNGDWGGGVGDLAVGFKRVLFHSMRSGSILSAAGEVKLPTGDKARGTGSGVTILEPFVSFGQILPSQSFFQFQGGIEAPTRRDDASNEAFWRTAVGRASARDRVSAAPGRR